MDPRVRMLKEFYGELPQDRAKIETSHYGFAFLEKLLTDGMTLEYGELTLCGVLHKYKLAHIPDCRMDDLLQSHVEKECNVCLYFDEQANKLFCYNLDNNHQTNNTAIIPEMELAVRVLWDRLGGLGCEPMIIASGRGYHIWCRLDAAVANERLYDFMLHSSVAAMAAIFENKQDYNKIKFNFYPDPRINNVVSLRLFGSDHAKNRVFSRILTPNALLDEAASWDYFEDYLRNKTIPREKFNKSYDAMVASS